MTDIDLHIARKLRALRAERGIHPELLDRAIGAPLGTVWRYEEGTRPIVAVHLYRLGKLLQTSIDEFFRDISAEPSKPDEMIETPPILPKAAPTPAEVQRFLAIYEKLEDPEIKQTVRDFLRSLSEEKR